MTIAKVSLLAAASFAFSTSATAAVLFNEPFAYADGELSTVSGGKWSPNVTPNPPSTFAMTVSSQKLMIDDNSNRDYNRSLSSLVSSGTVYAGFDLTVSMGDNASGSDLNAHYFAHFGQTIFNTDVSRLFLNLGSSAGKYKVGISSGTGVVGSPFWASELSTGTTYRVVQSFDLTTKKATLWVNPTATSAQGVTAATSDVAVESLGYFLLRVGGTGDGDKTLDNLIVATDFNTAAGIVPEPAGFALLGLGALALRRRR
ncbi:MAG TPA: hypothetical protein VGB55_02005 [Tepidisphaeraceae bacterium]|jgi:MYXO-CTERM domain-containing protein